MCVVMVNNGEIEESGVKYICKECKTEQSEVDYDAIVARWKTCDECISILNRQKLRKEGPSKVRQNKRKVRRMTRVCNKCGHTTTNKNYWYCRNEEGCDGTYVHK